MDKQEIMFYLQFGEEYPVGYTDKQEVSHLSFCLCFLAASASSKNMSETSVCCLALCECMDVGVQNILGQLGHGIDFVSRWRYWMCSL